MRRYGREPLTFGTAIGMMMTERGLVAPAAGGTILGDFDAVPDLAGHVAAVEYDADTGELTLRPVSAAWGQRPVWRRLGSSLPPIRQRGVLAPGTVTDAVTTTANPAPQPTVSAVTLERRTPPEGCHRAIEAHRQAARLSLADPGIAKAVGRQAARGA
ncbi:Hypothetical protein SCLAV_p0130, partial (plasmid) [Streptomyces clavuligerus]